MITTNKQIPTITKDFIKKIKSDAKKGAYRMIINGTPIDVFPFVFPPCSPFSESTHTVYYYFENLKGKKVLDIGTGTGILAIQAAKAGAKHVDALDIEENAVKCAKHNVLLNKLENRIAVYKGNLFDNVNGKYDLIIANLPIVDYPEKDTKFYSLFDPKFEYHKRLFEGAKNYLSERGKITLCHANLQSKNDFKKLEFLAGKYGFNYKIKKSVHSLGYEWRDYEFSVKGGNKNGNTNKHK